MSTKRFYLCLFFSLSISNSFSQDKNYKNEFGFRSDNDSYLLYGQDRYYTNGLFITFRHAMDQSKLSEQVEKKIWEAEAGQYMFNPFTGRITSSRNIDRPFAAYLYAGGKINWFFKDEKILQASLQMGTIGPSAKGKEAQELLHKLIGFYEIKGWEYQVRDEIGVNAAVEHTRLLKRWTNNRTDISFNGYLKAGNTFAGAGTGVLFRTGDINPLFQSVSTNSRISHNSTTDSIPKKELFFFARPSLHFIAYDASIQGGLFRDDKGPVTFDPKRFVFSQELGLMYSKKRWTIDFSIIFKSREVKSRAKAHEYGSASFYYRFD
jgi:hypothetical protein